MYTRHKEIPAFSAWPSRVEARCFYAVQRALRQRGSWLRLPLPDLAKLELILQPNEWIVVDPALCDLPIVAWDGLQPDPDLGLHAPIQCQLSYFHGAAGKVAAKVPGLMEELLQDVIGAEPRTDGVVIPFPGRAQ